MIQLKIKGFSKVSRKLREIEKITPKRLERGMYIATSKAADVARKSCPIDKGILKASIDNMVRNVRGAVIGFVFTPLKYGIFVHFGTGIFGPKRRVIRPRRAKVLRWKSGKETIYSKTSKGQKPTYFMNRALDFLSANGERIIVDFLKL